MAVVRSEEDQTKFHKWISGICKPIMVFMTLVGFATSYAYHTIENLHKNSPKTNYFLSFYTVVGWVAAFVARTQLYGFWQLIGLSLVVSCCCTLALVTTAMTQAYFYSTEVYVLGSCIVISLILFGIPVFRFHKKLRMLKAAGRAELAESVAREMMQQATAPTDIHGDANDHETSSSPIINPNHMSDLEEIKIVAERKVEEKPDDAGPSQPDRDINRPDSDGSPTNKTTLKCLTFFLMKNKQPEPKEKAEETLKTDDTPKG